MLTDNLSVLELVDVHGRNTNFLACGWHAHQRLCLCASHRVAYQNLVTLGNGFLRTAGTGDRLTLALE